MVEPMSHSRVLVAERDPLLRWALAETVRQCGFDVVSVDDVRAARSLTDAQVADVAAVMMDYDAGPADAPSFEWVHERFPDASVAVMAPEGVTARDRRRFGISQVFVKPFDLTLVCHYLSGLGCGGHSHGSETPR
jgi:DNA-binding NtrC family response regulator